GSPLAREPYLAVAEVAGTAAQGRIVLAAALGLSEIEAGQAQRIETREEIVFDAATASLRARRFRRLGALTLNEQPMTVVPSEDSARLLAQGIARLGIDRLPWSKALPQWRDRVMFLRRAEGHEWPDLSDAALAGASDWLIGLVGGKRALAGVTGADLG